MARMMGSTLAWLLCKIIGHQWSPWVEVTWLSDDQTVTQARTCQRCLELQTQ